MLDLRWLDSSFAFQKIIVAFQDSKAGPAIEVRAHAFAWPEIEEKILKSGCRVVRKERCGTDAEISAWVEKEKNGILAGILKRVYWETTAGCNLACRHCRRTDVSESVCPDDLSTKESKAMIDELAAFADIDLVLSGGEPLIRKDIFEIASYAVKKGIRVGMATNGTLVDRAMAARIKAAGIAYASVSLDGAKPETHEALRGKGNFELALAGFKNLKETGLRVQFNFTVTRQNAAEVPFVHELAVSCGASSLFLFLLVPVGCGVQIAESAMLGAAEVEQWLQWAHRKNQEGPLLIKTVCAPHYYRIEAQNDGASTAGSARLLRHTGESRYPEKSRDSGFHRNDGGEHEHSRKGCLAGIRMCFVAHQGDVYPCGYLPVSCGNVKHVPLKKIWQESPLFQKLRNPSLLGGRCGACSHKRICGGCRARAYSVHQDVLQEEPYCAYQPAG
ncbi:MAG: radical SAM protein [Elusimicrobia bacterium]|nr:radical SAM protein [Elusimicrobiota bacterium]